jgi:23S rRNA (uracil1939-C5)-methyltransferase
MELNAFDAVLFDPPRAGALPQAKALAKSRVPTVIAVSCSPVTFAKDARALIDGGYKLKQLTPIDQFVFSGHVELVAVFAKK